MEKQINTGPTPLYSLLNLFLFFRFLCYIHHCEIWAYRTLVDWDPGITQMGWYKNKGEHFGENHLLKYWQRISGLKFSVYQQTRQSTTCQHFQAVSSQSASVHFWMSSCQVFCLTLGPSPKPYRAWVNCCGLCSLTSMRFHACSSVCLPVVNCRIWVPVYELLRARSLYFFTLSINKN